MPASLERVQLRRIFPALCDWAVRLDGLMGTAVSKLTTIAADKPLVPLASLARACRILFPAFNVTLPPKRPSAETATAAPELTLFTTS